MNDLEDRYLYLNDINDKKIHESSILEGKNLIYKVILDDGSYWIKNKEAGIFELNSFMIKKLQLKVIGNIFENPKLWDSVKIEST